MAHKTCCFRNFISRHVCRPSTLSPQIPLHSLELKFTKPVNVFVPRDSVVRSNYSKGSVPRIFSKTQCKFIIMAKVHINAIKNLVLVVHQVNNYPNFCTDKNVLSLANTVTPKCHHISTCSNIFSEFIESRGLSSHTKSYCYNIAIAKKYPHWRHYKCIYEMWECFWNACRSENES